MNWYKRSQLGKEAGIGKVFMGLSIPIIAILMGTSIANVNEQIEKNPQALSQRIQQVQQTSDDDLIARLNQASEPNQLLTEQVDPNLPPTDPNQISDPNQPSNINLDKIWEIESSRGQDPNMDKNPSGARGHFQFMKNTWNEMVGLMGKNWDWKNGSMDYNKSAQVANYYLNTEIPRLLKSFNIPDNIETRLASYNLGIGNLEEIWDKYGDNWLNYAPTETQEYMVKYR